VSLPTSNTVTYTIDGQSHTATLESNGGIVDQNTGAASCSATLSKSSINSAGASSASSHPIILFAVLLVVVAVAF
jgi:hypothetical protein